jgi:hypothetical protein
VKTAVTFGRFNIGHPGHVELVKKLLTLGSTAKVYVSLGRQNNDWDLRVLLLRTLCRQASIDLSRVSFLKAIDPYAGLSDVLKSRKPSEVVLVLGSDQASLGLQLSHTFGVSFHGNERSGSSTALRKVLDQGKNPAPFQGNRYALKLATLLRNNEKFRKAQRKVKESA